MIKGIPRDQDSCLNHEQVDRIIDAATNPRDKAFAALLARTGIRVSEAIRLKVSDIDFEGGVLMIVHLKEKSKLKCPDCGESLGKRHLFCPGCGYKVVQAVREKVEHQRQRMIPVDPDTLSLVEEYLQWRCSFPYRGPLVFPFSRQRGWQVIERLGRRIGVKGLHPHSLRHFVATRWVNKGLDVKKLQIMLGHANIGSTMEYVDSSFDQLRSEYEKLWDEKDGGQTTED
ncbi:MAG: tyrosine-type recombinase/integrase [Chloroflexota bacterium]|nr:tyrosine-type recombinase/integrase [Chloroflexota bacterium]